MTQHQDNHHVHSHSLNKGENDVHTSAKLKRALFALLAVVAAATVLGLVWLWPDYDRVAEIAERANYQTAEVGLAQGEVIEVAECSLPTEGQQLAPPVSEQAEVAPAPGQSISACQSLSVLISNGPDEGRTAEIDVRGSLAQSGLRVGDGVQLMGYPNEHQGELQGGDEASGELLQRYELTKSYEVSGVVRHLPLIALTLLFAIVVIAVGRVRGFLALLALGVAAWVVLGFVLPAIVAGGPGLLIGIVASSAIMLVTLFFVHGINLKTTSALIGTLGGIAIISAISWASVSFTRLSGLGDETSGLLLTMVSEIDFRGLLTCSILIAGLGVLNDVTITQASSVWELRAAAPHMSRREIYTSAMRIGRDHIASTVYTVFFAYVGAAIGALILLYLYDRPALVLLTQEDLAIEIVRTVAGSIGLVLAVPITTAVAAMCVPPAAAESTGESRASSPVSDAEPIARGSLGFAERTPTSDEG